MTLFDTMDVDYREDEYSYKVNFNSFSSYNIAIDFTLYTADMSMLLEDFMSNDVLIIDESFCFYQVLVYSS